MSGGSHQYLYSQAPDELRGLADRIEEMASALDNGKLPVCATRTRRVAELIREAATEASALGNLWHDQEWADSGDYAQHDVRKSAAALGETFPPCPHVSKHSVYGHRDGHEGYNHSYLQCDECGADFDPEAT